jgi:hypothetical protein
MSIRHNNNQEIRYIKHQNLKEEARIIANYYRDLIHSYGMDCIYHKSTVDLPTEFSTVLTSNNILKQAYGYNPDIEFVLSANLITYTEVDEDIFVLDRIGIKNDQKISFYFDATEFATSFMTSLGQFKEYPIVETEVTGIIRANDNGRLYFETEISSAVLTGEVVCNTLIDINGGTAADTDETYNNELIAGSANALSASTIFIGHEKDNGANYGPYDGNPKNPKKGLVSCIVKSHSKPVFKLPVNEYIARSFSYEATDGEVSIVVYFKYDLYPDGRYKGVIQGTVLYYDLNLISTFAQKIKPNVGDIIVLDTSWGDIVYEVNEVKNQGLTSNDSLNPLVHKYIFKLAAQKRINSYEDTAPIEDATQAKLDSLTKANITDKLLINKITKFEDDREDLIYGGFTGKDYIQDNYLDTRNDRIVWDESKVYSSSIINILTFANGNSILTDGYNLYYRNIEEKVTKLTLSNSVKPKNFSGILSSLRYIKANKSNVYFQNIEGTITKLLGNDDMTIDPEFINKMETVADYDENIDGMNFYKFKNCKTLLFSTPYNLFCRLEKDSTFHLLA